ncbi:hypothetical protein LSTR_LSTR001429 [Laodelphax striatellus]|uniref:Uncharacterized protein n=1 Tax=Laodelphax striatellus TaxID=195883 RepID=A0A482X9Z5_LAOST|nr:hypothetical protein LSTR_LSTR001429 [Laodelphax striatellus]
MDNIPPSITSNPCQVIPPQRTTQTPLFSPEYDPLQPSTTYLHPPKYDPSNPLPPTFIPPNTTSHQELSTSLSTALDKAAALYKSARQICVRCNTARRQRVLVRARAWLTDVTHGRVALWRCDDGTDRLQLRHHCHAMASVAASAVLRHLEPLTADTKTKRAKYLLLLRLLLAHLPPIR